MINQIEPPPQGTPIQKTNLELTPPWSVWIRQILYNLLRTLTNGVNTLETNLASLTSYVNSLADAITAIGGIISQARWDDLRLVGSARTAGATPPTLEVFRGGLRAWTFQDGAVTKELFLQGQMPHGYIEGTDIKLHVHWGHISAADDGNVVWQAEWAWTNRGEAMAVPTVSTATPSPVLGAEQYFQLTQAIVTIPGTDKKISSILTVRLFRDPTHASDTSTANAYLFECDAHYQLDGAGSIGENTKT